MKKNGLKTMLVATAALLFTTIGLASCGSDSSSHDDPAPNTSGTLTGVVITGASSKIAASGEQGKLQLEASLTMDGTVDIQSYAWSLSGDTDVATLSPTNTQTVTLQANNPNATQKTVTVKVVVTDVNGNVVPSDEKTIIIEAKDTPVEDRINTVSITGTKDIAANGKTTLTADVDTDGTPELTYKWEVTGDTAAVTLGADGNATFEITGNNNDTTQKTVSVTLTVGTVPTTTPYVITIAAKQPENPEPDNPQTEATGTVSITVDVDGKYHCPVHDEHAYDTKEEAENCGETEDCPGYEYTVTFTNTDIGATYSTTAVKVKKGTALDTGDIPAWTHSDTTNTYDLEWTADAEHATYTITSLIRADVTFKTNWKQYYTVTFNDSVAGTGDDAIAAVEPVTKKVYADAEEKTVSAPDWAKTGYTLSWNPDFGEANDVTASVEYTAVWTGKQKYTVTFVDTVATPVGDGGVTVEKKDDESFSLFAGDRITDLPTWAHKTEFYELTWTSSVTGLSFGDAITQNVTLTAVWAEHKKYTVQFVDTAAGTGTDAIVAKTDSEKDSQIIYEGETATLPSWVTDATKTASYKISWKDEANASISDPSAVEITKNTIFTATWTEIPKETVITFGGSNGKTYTASGTPAGYATASAEKSYKTAQGYAADSGTQVSVTKGAKLNSSGSVTLKLDTAYTVVFGLGNDRQTDAAKGLTIDGTVYKSVLTDGYYIVTASLAAGNHTVKNGGSETSVFVIVLQK